MKDIISGGQEIIYIYKEGTVDYGDEQTIVCYIMQQQYPWSMTLG